MFLLLVGAFVVENGQLLSGLWRMADAPYLIALALLEQNGARALPLGGRSLPSDADPASGGGSPILWPMSWLLSCLCGCGSAAMRDRSSVRPLEVPCCWLSCRWPACRRRFRL